MKNLRCPTCGVQPASCFRRARRLRVHITAIVVGPSNDQRLNVEAETDGHEYVCDVCRASVIDVDLVATT